MSPCGKPLLESPPLTVEEPNAIQIPEEAKQEDGQAGREDHDRVVRGRRAH